MFGKAGFHRRNTKKEICQLSGVAQRFKECWRCLREWSEKECRLDGERCEVERRKARKRQAHPFLPSSPFVSESRKSAWTPFNLLIHRSSLIPPKQQSLSHGFAKSPR